MLGTVLSILQSPPSSTSFASSTSASIYCAEREQKGGQRCCLRGNLRPDASTRTLPVHEERNEQKSSAERAEREKTVGTKRWQFPHSARMSCRTCARSCHHDRKVCHRPIGHGDADRGSARGACRRAGANKSECAAESGCRLRLKIVLRGLPGGNGCGGVAIHGRTERYR